MVEATTDHFEGEFGSENWKCKKQRVREFDELPCFVFDVETEWKIEIHANKKMWKTITCNGNGSISEFKIEQADNIK